MSKTRLDPVRKIMPFVATVVIVAGVAAIVLSSPAEEASAPTADTSVIPIGPDAVTVYQGTDAVHITRVANGSMETKDCSLPQPAGRVTRVSRDGIIVGISGGQNVFIKFDCTAVDSPVPPGVLNNAGTQGARTGEARSDGTGAIIFADGTNENTVRLRSGNARPFRDPLLIGWMDDERVAVVAFQGDALHSLVVDRAGRVTSLGVLPETATEFRASGSAFWYVNATPGPGIEFGPRGPSDVHRVGSDAKNEIVARDAEHAIEALTPGTDGRFAYIAGGTLFLGKGSEVKNVGTGRPLGWMDDGALLVVRNGRLASLSEDGTATETETAIPDGIVQAWRVTLDEQSTAN